MLNRDDTRTFLAMKHGGYYAEAAEGAERVTLEAFDLIESALKLSISSRNADTFRCADYGCADGGTSMAMWEKSFEFILSHKPGIGLELVYDDLPNTDFNHLFRTIHGITGRRTYLDQFPDTLTFASANSFHSQVLSTGTLDFGFSALASHYLNSPPCNITSHIHMVGATGSELARFRDQGRADWERFLQCRSRELRSGGTLCIVNPGIDRDGHHLGNVGGIHMWNIFNEIWRSFAESGLITKAEYENTNFSQHYRTIEECIEPVSDSDNIVYQSGLRLVHVETRVVRCPKASAFAVHRDVDRFVREYVPSLRSWIEPTMLKGLSEERPSEQRHAIIDKLFSVYSDRARRSPEGHGFDYCNVYLIFRKEAT